MQDKKGALDTLYDNLISKELQRRMREAEGTSEREMERYRNEMEEERMKAGKRSKKISREQELLVSVAVASAREFFWLIEERDWVVEK